MRILKIAPIAALLGALVAPIATPAHAATARRTSAQSTIVRAGIKPINPGAQPNAEPPATLQSTASHGAVSQHPKVYLVFWGSEWSNDPAGAEPALQDFFSGLFGDDDTWGRILDQYCSGLAVGTVNCGIDGNHVVHPSSSLLAGMWLDDGTDGSDAPANATGEDLASEAIAAAEHFGNTTQASNIDAQYVIASASGAHPDGFPDSGFCAWHSSTENNSVGGTIAYTNLPYVPDLGAGACTTISGASDLDGYFSTESHEYGESVTDLWPRDGWLDADGGEIADKCQELDSEITLTTGTFDVQGLWSNVDSACEVAEAQDLAPAFRHAPSIHVDGTYEPVTGDFNGDGSGDILWYGTGSAPDSVWRGNGSGGFSNGPSINVNGLYVPLTGDFDGDGKADVLWYAPGTATDYIWHGTSGGFGPSRALTINGDYEPQVGDFNGDGKSDVLWYAPGNGHDFIWLGGGGANGFSNGPAINVDGVYQPVVGDFNGDSSDDVLWYSPGFGSDYLWKGSPSGFGPATLLTINGFYEPVAGDFDGDGFTDLLWYAPGPTVDYLWRGRTSGFSAGIRLVVNGFYEPVTLDVNGDHRTDIVWYAPGPAPDSTWLGVTV